MRVIRAGDSCVPMEHATTCKPPLSVNPALSRARPGHPLRPSKPPPPRAGSTSVQELGGSIQRGCRDPRGAVQGRGRDHSTAAGGCPHRSMPAPLSEPRFPSLQNKRAGLPESPPYDAPRCSVPISDEGTRVLRTPRYGRRRPGWAGEEPHGALRGATGGGDGVPCRSLQGVCTCTPQAP